MSLFHRSSPALSRVHLILLSLLVVAHGLSNYYILKHDTVPRVRHDAFFFRESYTVLKHWSTFDVIGRFSMERDYPLFFLDIAAPIFALFGHTPDIGSMTNAIFLALLVFALYGLGRQLFSPGIGLLAAFLATTFPHLFGMSRNFTLDYPMTAMVALAFWALLRTDFFQSRRRSLLFGLCAGLGVSTKTVFLVTFLGPFFFYLGVAFLKPRKYEEPLLPAGERALNLGLALLVALPIIALWNWASIQSVAAHTKHCIDVTTVAEKYPLYYVQRLFCFQLLAPHSILLILSLAAMLAGHKNWPRYFVLLWFLLPFSVFTFVIPMNQDPRFTMPILPAAAVVMAAFILKPRGKGVRAAAIAAVVLFGIAQYGILCFFPQHAGPYNRLNRELSCNALIVSDHEFPYFTWQRGLLCPQEVDLPLDPILDALTEAHNRSGRAGTRCPVLVLASVRPDRGYLHDILINAYIALPKSDLDIVFLPERSPRTDEEIARDLSEFDYVVYADIGFQAEPTPEELSPAADYFLDHIDRYRRLETFRWIDGREISVFQSRVLGSEDSGGGRKP